MVHENRFCKENNECIEINTRNEISSECSLEYYSTGILKSIPNLLNRKLKNCLNNICHIGEYKCKSEEICISVKLVCDGVEHCFMGDDEMNCG